MLPNKRVIANTSRAFRAGGLGDVSAFYNGSLQLSLRQDFGFVFRTWSAIINCDTKLVTLDMQSSSWKESKKHVAFMCEIRVSSQCIAEFLECLPEYSLGIEVSYVRRIRLSSPTIEKLCVISGEIAVERFEAVWEPCVRELHAHFPREFQESLKMDLVPWHVAQGEWRKPFSGY